MIIAQRASVATAFARAEAPHPGLLLQRGLATQGDEKGQENTAASLLLERVAGATPGEFYRDAYARWRALLAGCATIRAVEAAVHDTLIVGLGGEGVLETAISLQHAYGMPFIPGSALKGLSRHYATQVLASSHADPQQVAVLSPAGVYHDVLFGRQDGAGYIVYHDAWYVPASAPEDRPFVRDVITVHHPRYYTRAHDRRVPWDFDDPIPVSFIGARGHYLVAVEGPTAQWAAVALQVLLWALADVGAGGKTSSGYGRLTPIPGTGINDGLTTAAGIVSAGQERQPTPPQPPARHPLAVEVDAIAIAQIKPRISSYVDRWRVLEDEMARAQVGRALLIKAEALDSPKGKQQKAPGWMQEVRDYLDAHEDVR